MHLTLGENNKSFDAGDIAAIPDLYGASQTTDCTADAAMNSSGTDYSRVNQLIQAMATFSPQESALTQPCLSTETFHDNILTGNTH
jgi:hypothetical protein